MGIKGGLHHQILYMSNIELIDEGHRGIKWNPPSFTLNGTEIPEADYVEIHDDLFMRFHDYFSWIETYNPNGPKDFNRGFNYYGTTVIHGENLVKFGKIIDSLMDLFDNSPENIILTGSFCWNSENDEALNNGYYQQIEIKKDKLLKIFDSLKKMIDKAKKSNGYILHCGI